MSGAKSAEEAATAPLSVTLGFFSQGQNCLMTQAQDCQRQGSPDLRTGVGAREEEGRGGWMNLGHGSG